MSTFNEQDHPRHNDGRFAGKPEQSAGIGLGAGSDPLDAPMTEDNFTNFIDENDLWSDRSGEYTSGDSHAYISPGNSDGVDIAVDVSKCATMRDARDAIVSALRSFDPEEEFERTWDAAREFYSPRRYLAYLDEAKADATRTADRLLNGDDWVKGADRRKAVADAHNRLLLAGDSLPDFFDDAYDDRVEAEWPSELSDPYIDFEQYPETGALNTTITFSDGDTDHMVECFYDGYVEDLRVVRDGGDNDDDDEPGEPSEEWVDTEWGEAVDTYAREVAERAQNRLTRTVNVLLDTPGARRALRP